MSIASSAVPVSAELPAEEARSAYDANDSQTFSLTCTDNSHVVHVQNNDILRSAAFRIFQCRPGSFDYCGLPAGVEERAWRYAYSTETESTYLPARRTEVVYDADWTDYICGGPRGLPAPPHYAPPDPASENGPRLHAGEVNLPQTGGEQVQTTAQSTKRVRPGMRARARAKEGQSTASQNKPTVQEIEKNKGVSAVSMSENSTVSKSLGAATMGVSQENILHGLASDDAKGDFWDIYYQAVAVVSNSGNKRLADIRNAYISACRSGLGLREDELIDFTKQVLNVVKVRPKGGR